MKSLLEQDVVIEEDDTSVPDKTPIMGLDLEHDPGEPTARTNVMDLIELPKPSNRMKKANSFRTIEQKLPSALHHYQGGVQDNEPTRSTISRPCRVKTMAM
jgi:hypothetical protein